MRQFILLGLAACLQAVPVASAAPGASGAASSSTAAATFESKFAEGERLTKHGPDWSPSKSMTSFQEAAALAREPAQKARALGEISVLAQEGDEPWTRIAVQASCEALRLVSGAARASHLFNLGRSAEAIKDVASATALYTNSLALRPNAIVSARLAKLSGGKSGASIAAVTPAAGGTDPSFTFCQTALGPPPAISPEFRLLAQSVATQRGEKISFVARRPLGLRGELFPVAYLCSGSQHGSWLIEVDATHRFLVAIDELDGRAELDACRNDDSDLLYAGRGAPVALRFRQGYHRAYDDYSVGVRNGRPAVIYINKFDNDRRQRAAGARSTTTSPAQPIPTSSRLPA